MEWREAIFIKFYMDLCWYVKCELKVHKNTQLHQVGKLIHNSCFNNFEICLKFK